MNYKFLYLLLGCLFITNIMATPPVMKNDQKRPVDDISRDLSITTAEFVSCFNNDNPTPGGARPESSERVKANKDVRLPCLQKANPSITNDALDKVMDRYRPGGKKAQDPKS